MLSLAVVVSFGGCKNEPSELEKLGVSEEEAHQILKKIAEASAHPTSSTPLNDRAANRDEPRSDNVPIPPPATTQEESDPDLLSDRWLVDGLVDVSEAGQSSAHARGVYMVTESHELLLAPLGKLSQAKEPASTPVAELPDGSGPFKLSRGPSFSEHHAYWISEHYLFRAPLDGKGPVERLADDARVATRVSAVSINDKGKTRDFVAYIALPNEKGGPLLAKLWYEGGPTLLLTEEGSAALSVQLSLDDDSLVAYSLEGRTGMSILHARPIDTKSGPPKLGGDQAVWVGGGATPTTELRVARGGKADVLGLLPIERDTLHFGMVILELSAATADHPAVIRFAPYLNGMEYAPVNAANVCGRLSVLFARPSSAAPHAPQELVLGEMQTTGIENELVLSRSRAFFDASLAAVPQGALISYVADRRTWARAVRCK